MFDQLLNHFFITEIARVGSVVGLSAGALIGCAALAYFVGTARPLAIALAAVIAAGLGGFLYGTHTAIATVKAEWAAADAKAEADAKARDTDAQKTIEAKYDPIIAARDSKIAELQNLVKVHESQPLQKGAPCTLGSAALRLRRK
jgi:hypothetical protein